MPSTTADAFAANADETAPNKVAEAIQHVTNNLTSASPQSVAENPGSAICAKFLSDAKLSLADLKLSNMTVFIFCATGAHNRYGLSLTPAIVS
jgi:hypothetical protein